MGNPETSAAALLYVDLEAVAANYRTLRGMLRRGAACAGVVKADAYGLGAAKIAPVLWREGCRHFFVAQAAEGMALREALPDEAWIAVLNGPAPGSEDEVLAHRLTPVLNSLQQVDAWAALARNRSETLGALLHVDTGMSRLGLDRKELHALAEDHSRLDGIRLEYVMSHLACADEPAHPLNAQQLEEFNAARRRLPQAPASLTNSPGIYLGAAYHGDLARPGMAIYGLNPTPDAPNPMTQAVNLKGKIIQIRQIDTPRTVGYGAAWRAQGPTRIATVGVGYADGFLRHLSNRATAYFGDTPIPLVGRVSMDLITLDISALPPDAAAPGTLIDLIGKHNPPDAVADAAGTIGYEILTSLGARYHRVYT
ncbi:MAG: alanine racemase [Acetobacterales bacterium]